MCQNCEVCGKDVYEQYLCLYADRDCYEGCGFCLDSDECKYEGGYYDDE